jgi:hypothetical protein
MNYLGAEPAWHQIRTLNFLLNTSLFWSVPFSREGSLTGKGDFYLFEAVQKGCSIKNFTSKQSYHAPAWYLLSISTIGDPVSPEGIPSGTYGMTPFLDSLGIKPLRIKMSFIVDSSDDLHATTNC